MAAPPDDEAGEAFVQVLKGVGLPESLWDGLLERIPTARLGADGAFEALPAKGGQPARVVAKRRLTPTADVFLLPHVVAATRPGLQQQLREDAGFAQLVAGLLQLPEGHSEEDAFQAFFAWAKPSPQAAGASLRALTTWHLLPPEGLWTRHAEAAPNMNVAALPDFVVSRIGAGAGGDSLPGASLLWPKTAIREGQEVTRDWLPGNRSLQRAAVLLALLQPQASRAEPSPASPAAAAARWAVPAEHDGLAAAVEQAAAGTLPPGAGPAVARPWPSDKRAREPQASRSAGDKLRVHFAYPGAAPLLSHPRFQAVEEAEEADVLFYSSPVRNFLSIPTHQMISQFPYEGAIVRKDLLPATLRRLAAAEAADAGAAAAREPSPARWHPSILPPTYDLATEPHFFIADYRQRAAAGADNHWVVKQAQGTRSSDACVTDDAATVLAYRSAPGGDRVVQKYLSNPVTWRGRKFDLRLYVAVRSIVPLDAYLFTGWYARAANKEFGLAADGLTDFETHFTVVCYEEETALSESQAVVSKAELEPELRKQGVDMAALEQQLRGLAHDVLTAASTQVGSWPSSRAIYGLDVMLATSDAPAASAAPPASSTVTGDGSNSSGSSEGSTQQATISSAAPRLLEVNSAPDFGLVAAQHPQFLNDAFEVLFPGSDGAPPPASFVRL